MDAMSAACTPVLGKAQRLRTDAPDVVAGQKVRSAGSDRVPASFPPADSKLAITPRALPRVPQYDSDLLDKLSAMCADQAETRRPLDSAPVVADRQGESLAKSLGVPAASPPRQNTLTIMPRILSSDPQSDSDLLDKLSSMYAKQARTRTPLESAPVVADRQAEDLAKLLGVPASSPPRPNRFTLTPRALPSYFQSDDDLLDKLAGMHADQGESEVESPPPSDESTSSEGTAARPSISVAEAPRSAVDVPALDDAIALVPAAETTPNGVQSSESRPAQVPLVEALPAGAPARNKWLALLPSLRSMSGDQNERRDASHEASGQVAIADPEATVAARNPSVAQSRSPEIPSSGNTTGQPAARRSPAPRAVQGLLSQWHRLRYGRQTAPAVQVPVLADATQQIALEANEPTEALDESPDAIGAADTNDGIATSERIPSTPPVLEPNEVFESEPAEAQGADAIAATPTEPLPNDTFQPPVTDGGEPATMPPAEPAPLIAADPLSYPTAQPQAWGGQPIAVPSGPAGPAPGQVVVVVVMPSGGAPTAGAPQPVYAQSPVAAPEPAPPVATTEYSPIGPDYYSLYQDGVDPVLNDYAPARLALQSAGQGAAPLSSDNVAEGTLPAPPENGQPAPSEPGALPAEPGAEADTLADADKLGEEPVNNELQFLSRETVLLKPGEWQFDIGLVYSYQQNDIPIVLVDGMANIDDVIEGQIRQRELFIPFAVRYGATERIQLFVNAPVGWASTELSFVPSDEFESDGGIGDITLGASFLVNTNECRDVVFTFATTAPTGDNPFAAVGSALPVAALGDGFWSFFGELLCIQTYDPVVVFTSLGTQQSIQREFFGAEIRPGGEYFWTFGAGLAVNPRVTLSTRFIAQYISETTIDSERVPGTIQEPMAIRMAATIAQTDYFVEPFVQFGTNDDAVDTLFGVIWTY
jgi:hypothetical protein